MPSIAVALLLIGCIQAFTIHNNSAAPGGQNITKFGYGNVETNCKNECPEGFSLCAKTKVCIFAHWQCDGVVDCSESEDELDCMDYKKKDADSHFNKAFSAAVKTDCSKTKLTLKKIIRKMTPEEMTAFSKAVNDYIVAETSAEKKKASSRRDYYG